MRGKLYTSFLPLSWQSKNSTHISLCYFQIKIVLLTVLPLPFILLPITLGTLIEWITLLLPWYVCAHVCMCICVQSWLFVWVHRCDVCVYTYVPCVCLWVHMCVFVFCFPIFLSLSLFTFLGILSSFTRNVFLKHLMNGSLTGLNVANVVEAGFDLYPFLSLANSKITLLKLAPKVYSLFSSNSFLRLNTKIQQSKFIIWLLELNCPIRTYWLILI